MLINKKALVAIIVLVSIEFFSISAFPKAIREGLQLLMVIAALAVIILNIVYYKIQSDVKKNFSIEIAMIFIAVFLSMIGAQLWQGQSIKTTLLAQRFMYLYLIYYLLHIIKPNTDDVIDIFIIMAFGVFFLYIAQFFLYPRRILDCRVGFDRGTIRIFMPGFYYLTFSYYIFILRYFYTKKILNAVLAGVLFIIFILMGTRQIIASIGLLTLISILRSKILTNKFAILFILTLCALAVFYMFQDMFMEMLNVSMEQKDDTEENIRMTAAKYFLFEFFPNKLSYFIGNGADSLNSPYGLRIAILKLRHGFYQSDIGIIGDYTKFGVLYVIACFSIMIKVYRVKLPEYFVFIKLTFWGLLLGMVTGKFPFGSAPTIVSFSFLMYLIDTNKNKTNKDFVSQSRILKKKYFS